jgi:cell division GTPase FtsZ
MEPNENNRAKPNIKIKNRITNNSIGTDLKKKLEANENKKIGTECEKMERVTISNKIQVRSMWTLTARWSDGAGVING